MEGWDDPDEEVEAPTASTCCSATTSEPPPTDCIEEWWWCCERALEDWNGPEEVLAPVSSISAGSTALMFMLTDCTDSLVDGDDSSASACAAASARAILAGDHDLAIVHSIGFTLLVELRLTRKSLPSAGFLRQPKSSQVKNYYTRNRLVWV